MNLNKYIRELDVVLTLLGGFCLVDLFPSSHLARLLSSSARQMKRSYGNMQRIIEDVIDKRRKGAFSSGTDDEDLVDVLLRLQKEDSLELPITRETICAVLFVSIFNHPPSLIRLLKFDLYNSHTLNSVIISFSFHIISSVETLSTLRAAECFLLICIKQYSTWHI
jgi:hypothetical protein